MQPQQILHSMIYGYAHFLWLLNLEIFKTYNKDKVDISFGYYIYSSFKQKGAMYQIVNELNNL